MKTFLVGSAIHGDLLSPNDTDIAIETISIEEFNRFKTLYSAEDGPIGELSEPRIATARHGDLNIIILHNISVKDYTKGMDVNVVRGYLDVEEGRLFLHPEAKQGLQNKIIEFLGRDIKHQALFNRYDGSNDVDRRKKYLDKLPKGWKLIVTNNK